MPAQRSNASARRCASATTQDLSDHIKRKLRFTQRGPFYVFHKGSSGCFWGHLQHALATSDARAIVLKTGSDIDVERGPFSPLYRRYCHQRDVKAAILSFSDAAFGASLASVPRHLAFLRAMKEDWAAVLPHFEPRFRPTLAAITQRIGSVSEAGQRTVAAAFCPKHVDKIMATAGTRHCVMCLHLGCDRRTFLASSAGQAAKKKNSIDQYTLCRDEVERLALPAAAWARTMASTLAVIHWSVGIDAEQISFVLGQRDCDRQSTRPLGEHRVWVLGFDRCAALPEDEDEAADIIARGFWRNRRMFTVPQSKPGVWADVWAAFEQQYVEACAVIMGDESKGRAVGKMVTQRIVDSEVFANDIFPLCDPDVLISGLSFGGDDAAEGSD